ncbi:MAG: type II-A CRISPR-associated protein Csn2 [Clostridiales bacterium]|nr:type II-A CRISPR-associated protein Csn2 [Clostridiales bacterium]
MKFSFDFLETPVHIDGLTSITIEDTRIFAKIVSELYKYSEDTNYIKLFDNNYNTIKPVEIMLITDILGFDINSAMVKKRIFTDLELQISDNPILKTRVENLLTETTHLIAEEILDFEIDLEFEEITFAKLFHALAIQVEIETDTVFERLLDIVRIFKYLPRKEVLILVNCGSYLLPAEATELESCARLQNVKILMFDRIKIKGLSRCFVLDEDYVMLEEKNHSEYS